MKIITYNVNGIRAAIKKDFVSWLKAVDADVVCLQETKATEADVDLSLFEELGYRYNYFYSAEKKGYSGVAILSKKEPKHVAYGCGIEAYDSEGRIIRADYEDFSVMSVYIPSGTSGDHRQDIKYTFLDDFYVYIHELKKTYPNLIIGGDYNICHRAIDIHNPKSNAKTTGFLPEERAWMEKLFTSGFVDAFRLFCEEPHHYTWWSYRAGARGKNLGWRIDYFAVTEAMKAMLERCVILSEAVHSDHCPVLLELK